MSEVVAFMLELATSPTKQLAFAASPTDVLRASGLSRAEQERLLSREAGPLLVAHADTHRPLARFFFEPGPDPMPDPDPGPDRRR